MGKMIKFEFRKLFRSTAFYICTAIVLGFIIAYVGIMKLTDGILAEFGDLGISNVGAASFFSAYGNGNVSLLGAIFVCIFISEDYQQDTMKNIIARGYSKQTSYWAKYLASLSAFLIMFTLATASGVGLMSAFFGFGEMPSNFVVRFIPIILSVIAYHAIFFAFAITFRKIALSITVSVLLSSLVGVLIQGIDLLINQESFKISWLWIDTVMSDMNGADPNFGLAYNVPWIYIIVALLVSNIISQKKEIK